MTKKLTSAEDVNTFATETATDLETIKAQVVERDETVKSLGEQLTAMAERLKTVQVQLKDAMSIEREDTEESRLYKLGKFIKALINKDAEEVARLGGIPTVDNDGHFAIKSGFEEQYKALSKAYYEKTAITSTPLRSDATTGSYLIPTDVMAEVVRVVSDASVMESRITRVPQRGLTMYVPNTTDSFAFPRLTNQVTAKTEKNPSFSRATLTMETYANWTPITEEMDEDSLVALGAFIRTWMAEGWGKRKDELVLSDATYGAIKATGVEEVIMGAGDTSFASVTPYYLDDMIAKLTTLEKRRGAAFFMSPSVWDYIANWVDDKGQYVIRRFSDAEPLSARGYPVVLTDGMPAITASAISTSFIGFGNPRFLYNGFKPSGFEFRVFDQTQDTMRYDLIFLRARIRESFVNAFPTAWVKLTTAAK